MDTLAKSILSLRKLEGLSQQQLADYVGVTRSAISMYESGTINPKMEVLERIAAVFGVTVSSMLFDANEEAAKYGIVWDSIPEDEYQLLSCYRKMPPRFRALLLESAMAYADRED